MSWFSVSSLNCFLPSLSERKEVPADGEAGEAGADPFRGVLHSPAVPAALVRVMCGRAVLHALPDPHRAPAFPLPSWRQLHPQRHVDPALPL